MLVFNSFAPNEKITTPCNNVTVSVATAGPTSRSIIKRTRFKTILAKNDAIEANIIVFVFPAALNIKVILRTLKISTTIYITKTSIA